MKPAGGSELGKPPIDPVRWQAPPIGTLPDSLRRRRRPLGFHIARDGRLLICDSPRGLLAMDRSTGKIETLADEVDGRALKFCSNVTETANGTIYFTESTSAFTYADAVAAVLEARGRGSLLRRDPDGTVLTLVRGAVFRQWADVDR